MKVLSCLSTNSMSLFCAAAIILGFPHRQQPSSPSSEDALDKIPLGGWIGIGLGAVLLVFLVAALIVSRKRRSSNTGRNARNNNDDDNGNNNDDGNDNNNDDGNDNNDDDNVNCRSKHRKPCINNNTVPQDSCKVKMQKHVSWNERNGKK